MSHAYPLARNARDAVTKAQSAARSRAEAVSAAKSETVTGLETEWLTLEPDEADDMLEQAAAGPAHGFLQRYEDASGNLVLAVTYWKLAPATIIEPIPITPPAAPVEDDTDDLYFRSSTSRTRRKAKPVDPNQLDMFADLDKPS